jgi:release factor glutamine methyltransferase
MHFDRIVDRPQLDALHKLVKRAVDSEPIPYLIGKTEFYSLPIKVTPACLIPRPETELLVERAIDFLRQRKDPQKVLDLCTGSGCIAIAVAKNFENCSVIATDISDAALALATENIKTHNLEGRIRLFCGDLFDPIIAELDESKFDLILCNPPYVTSAEYQTLDKNIKNYEPHNALDAGTDGLGTYRKIAQKIHDFLNPSTALILEIGYAQGPAVKEILEQTQIFNEINIEKDLHNNDRIVTAKT